MGERVTKIRYSAQVEEYISGVERMADKTREAGSEAEKLAQKKQAFQLVGAAAMAMGLALAAGLAVAVTKAADFDQAMSYVDAATHETADNMGLLRQAALDAGASTVYSATESANAIEELGKAGLSTKDILSGGLTGSLDLAAAGGLGVAEAAGAAATALQQFGLKGSDTSHVADLLAAGAGKAMGDVTDLSQALSQAGLVANAAGLSIEETTGGLSAFASAGLLGSDAGTSFKSMLQRLTPQSAEAKAKMEELGISAYDASGQFIGLSAFAGNLQNALKDLTPEQRNAAQAVIFGSDAVRASNVLYEEGAKGIQDWIDKVDDQGYAADTAARRLDNLKGDVEKLGGAFDTALIATGSVANDTLRFLTQSATYAVDAFGSLPGPVQGAAFGIGVLTTAVLLGTGAFFLGAPKVAEYKTAIATLGPSAERASKAVGTVAKAAGLFGTAATIATVAGGFLFDQLEKLKVSSTEAENAIKTAGSAQEILSRASKGMEVTWWTDIATDADSVKDALQSAANSSVNFFDAMSQTNAQKGIIDTIKRVGDGLGELAGKDLPAAQDGFRQFAKDLGLNERQQWQLLSNMEPYKQALVDQANELDITASKANLLALANGSIKGPTDDAADSVTQVSSAAEVAQTNIDDLAESIRNFGKGTLDTRDATRQYEQAIDDIAEKMGADGWEATLDDTTAAGRDNNAMLDDLASSTLDLSAAIVAQTGDTDAARAAMESGRAEFVNTAIQMGLTEEAANKLADQVGLIPTNVVTNVTLTGAESMQDRINSIVSFWENRGINIPVYTIRQDDAMAARGPDGNANGGMYSYANGGFGEGIYSGRPGALYKFAEPEVGWEAFVSGKPGMEDRNRGIALEALSRLGGVPSAPVASNVVVNPTVSLNGARVVVDIGGQQFEGLVRSTIDSSRQLIATGQRAQSRALR